MSLEAALVANTAALEALTAAMASSKTSTSTAAAETETTTTKTTKAVGRPAKTEKAAPKHTREEMAAVMTEVKEKFDAETAKGIIKTVGGADKLKDVGDDKIDAVYAAGKEKLEETADDDM